MLSQYLLSSSQEAEKKLSNDQRITRSQSNTKIEMANQETVTMNVTTPAVQLTPKSDRSNTASPKPTGSSQTKSSGSSQQLLGEILTELKFLRQEVKELSQNSGCKCQNRTKSESCNETTTQQTDLSVTRLIDAHKKIWNDLLTKRKMAFFNELKNNGKATIYENYLAREPPFIPKICREKDVIGQTSQEWLQLKKDRELANTSHNIEKMKTFAKHHAKVVEEVDEEIKKKFENQNVEIRDKIAQIWQSEVAVEENVSRDLWKKSKDHLEDLPNKVETQVENVAQDQRKDTSEDQRAQTRTQNKKKPKGRAAQLSPRYQNQVHSRGQSAPGVADPRKNSATGNFKTFKNKTSTNFRQANQLISPR